MPEHLAFLIRSGWNQQSIESNYYFFFRVIVFYFCQSALCRKCIVLDSIGSKILNFCSSPTLQQSTPSSRQGLFIFKSKMVRSHQWISKEMHEQEWKQPMLRFERCSYHGLPRFIRSVVIDCCIAACRSDFEQKHGPKSLSVLTWNSD